MARRKSQNDIQAQFNRIRSYSPNNQFWFGRVQRARRIAQGYLDNIDARLNKKKIPYDKRANLKAPQYAYRFTAKGAVAG